MPHPLLQLEDKSLSESLISHHQCIIQGEKYLDDALASVANLFPANLDMACDKQIHYTK